MPTPRETEPTGGPSQLADLLYNTRCSDLTDGQASTSGSTSPLHVVTQPFLPGLVEYSLIQQELPTIQEIAVLFVDLADSTRLMRYQSSAHSLTLVQRFMSIVTEQALAHCGDVKDYEGDGALLYFGSVAQATRAALAMRSALTAERVAEGHPLQARFSVNVGEVTVAVIGSPLRRSVALFGPTVNLAARLLKQSAPSDIIAPHAAIEQLRKEAPEVAAQFSIWGENLLLKGFEEERVSAFIIPESRTEIAAEACTDGLRISRCQHYCHSSN